MEKRIKKFDGGAGAILCNGCREILMQGFSVSQMPGKISFKDWDSDEPLYCEKCQKSELETNRTPS